MTPQTNDLKIRTETYNKTKYLSKFKNCSWVEIKINDVSIVIDNNQKLSSPVILLYDKKAEPIAKITVKELLDHVKKKTFYQED